MSRRCFFKTSLSVLLPLWMILDNGIAFPSDILLSTQRRTTRYTTKPHVTYCNNSVGGGGEDGDQQQQKCSTAFIPAGEEALHSARMARSIRKFRTNRGLFKEQDFMDINDQQQEEQNEATTAINIRSKLLLTQTKSDRLVTQKGTASSRKSLVSSATVAKRVKGWSLTTTSNNDTRKKGESSRRSLRTNGIDLPYESALKALKVYCSLHGNLVMPRRYTVPEDEAYPREWHGVDLASAVYDMKWWQKNIKQKPQRVEELNKMGFLWGRLQPAWNLVLEALITYSSLHGDVMVPIKFVVPYGDDKWPKATWGILLGNCVFRIRHRNDFLRGNSADSRRDQLDGLGFVWDIQEQRFQQFYAALKHFAKIEGKYDDTINSPGETSSSLARRNTALRVPSTFVVPKKSEAWPEDLWGYQLGVKCTAIRQKQLHVKDNPRRQHLLENLGFHWNGNASLGWLEVVHAAAIYSKMHNRNLDVPNDFVVPHPPTDADPTLRVDTCTAAEDDNTVWPWPEYLWGLPLGQRLKDVRLKGAYLKGKHKEARRRQLDALGFNWKPTRGRRKKSR